MPVKQPPRRNLHPRNQRTVQVAQNTIQRVAPLAQEQYNNALSVNGYDVIIYNRLFNGRKCSCSISVKESPTILDEDGNATQEHIQSILTGRRFGIKDYNTQMSENPASTDIDVTQSDITEPLIESTQTITTAIGPHSARIEPDTDDFTLETNLGADMEGRCGICYGNAFVGGYNIFNGVRIVLDTTYFALPDAMIPNASTFNTTILKGEQPYKFDVNDNGYVVFQTVLPKNVMSLDGIRLWNNLDRVKAKLEIKNLTDVSFVTLSALNIMNFCTGLPVQIKISNVRYFTHLELQFNASEKPAYIEYPRLTKTGDLSVLDAIDGVSLVASPLVASLQPWDIIVDNVLRKTWRVTSSNWFFDRTLNIHGWDVQARLVQEYEIQFNMLSRSSQKKVTTNFNR